MKHKSTVASKAASLLGKRSWQTRVEKYGLKKLRRMLAESGKKATGRPRLPDDQVKQSALYQRQRREKLRAEAKLAKGKGKRDATKN